MIKKTTLATFETKFVFEIDTELFTVEAATEVNKFWSDYDYRLDKFDNDVHVAALSLYAAVLFGVIVEHNPPIDGAAYFFNRDVYEGYIPLHDNDDEKTHLGIKVVDFEVAIPSATDFEVEAA